MPRKPANLQAVVTGWIFDPEVLRTKTDAQDRSSRAFRSQMKMHGIISPLWLTASLLMLGCEDSSSDRPSVELDEQTEVRTLDKVKAMPRGFNVVQIPQTVEAIEAGDWGSSYRWEHQTLVTPIVDNLRIREFGYFVVVNDKLRFHTYARDGQPYDSYDFATFFDCPDAPLVNGQVYSRTDWTENGTLEKSVMTSYFVGEDSAGQLYSGYAEVTKAPRLKSKEGEQEDGTSDGEKPPN